VSARPNLGATICDDARPAATQVPTQREQVTSSPSARRRPTPAGRSSSPSTNGSRTKLARRSRESVLEALNVAAESASRSSAVAGGERRARSETAPRLAKNAPTIAA